MSTVRLTAAQAVVRYLAAQRTTIDGAEAPLFAGVLAIFGHGNVAGLGEALYQVREVLPTYRAHNEQGMAHAAIAFAKAKFRRQMMACTTSIGPGALNMVTAAALAHVNRLPVLLLPGDTFASRRPDPVLQQVEDFGDGTVTANDCFRPVSRYFDRITRPEQLLAALPRAIQVLTDPAECGPVTLGMSQDVQAEAYDFPSAFFAPRTIRFRRPAPDEDELAAALELLRRAERPLIVAGGGVLYSEADGHPPGVRRAPQDPGRRDPGGQGFPRLRSSAERRLDRGHGLVGRQCARGRGRRAARDRHQAAGLHHRLARAAARAGDPDPAERRRLRCRQARSSAAGRRCETDARDARSGAWAMRASEAAWQARVRALRQDWDAVVDRVTAATNALRPSDAQVLGAVNRSAPRDAIVVCAAGGLPGELHKLWRTGAPGGYHLEYGFSCMGYEIAGGLGVKLAEPGREVFVLVGDGSYLMLNSELATAVMLGLKLTVVLLDNRGYGCINRLQRATGGASFNNLFDHVDHMADPALIDFAAHARTLGAEAEKVASIADLEAALERARRRRTGLA